MDLKSTASQLILQILSKQSPELGARLKQKLNLLLVERGLSRFDEKQFGYKRFSDFLQQALGEQLNIEFPSGAGDTSISLKHPTTLPISSVDSTALQSVPELPVIRSDIWQAFINPDPNRKRFLHKETKLVTHFIETDQSPSKDAISKNIDQYFEIIPIDPNDQLGWMRTFLKELRLPLSQRQALEALIGETYSSVVNATFTRALGDDGDAWRHYRTNNVVRFLKQWAKQHEIRFGDFCVSLAQKKGPVVEENAAQHSLVTQLTPRQQASMLLQMLSDEEITQSVIPNLVNVFLLKPRV